LYSYFHPVGKLLFLPQTYLKTANYGVWITLVEKCGTLSITPSLSLCFRKHTIANFNSVCSQCSLPSSWYYSGCIMQTLANTGKYVFKSCLSDFIMWTTSTTSSAYFGQHATTTYSCYVMWVSRFTCPVW